MRKKNILKYESALPEYPDVIVPSKSVIPQWYRDMNRWTDGKMIDENNSLKITVKNCMPFLDSLSAGYMVTLAFDLYVKNINSAPYIAWYDESSEPIRWRDKVANENLVPAGYYPMEYTWNPYVSFEIPKDHSVLFTHPFNRYDLPFITLSGIIDGGWSLPPHGNFPFYIKSGFEGMIKQGTPIAQILPFKKELWHSQKTSGLVENGKSNKKKSSLVFSGWYKNNFWKRKDYL